MKHLVRSKIKVEYGAFKQRDDGNDKKIHSAFSTCLITVGNRQTNKSKSKSTSNSASITLTYLTFVHTLPFRYLRCRAAFEDQTKIKKKFHLSLNRQKVETFKPISDVRSTLHLKLVSYLVICRPS